MRLAVLTVIQNAALASGLLTLVVAGVKLHIDREMEAFFIEVEPSFDRNVLKVMSALADRLGYEAMPRWECPPEQLPNGALRHWLVEKEVVHDSSLQAV